MNVVSRYQEISSCTKVICSVHPIMIQQKKMNKVYQWWQTLWWEDVKQTQYKYMNWVESPLMVFPLCFLTSSLWTVCRALRRLGRRLACVYPEIPGASAVRGSGRANTVRLSCHHQTCSWYFLCLWWWWGRGSLDHTPHFVTGSQFSPGSPLLFRV